MLGRYFYFESNGSTKNVGNHYVEIQIVDKNGVNRALGRGLLRYSTYNTAVSPPSAVTDGNTNNNNHFDNGEGLQYIVIDLGDIYDISYIKVWRYYGDGRQYKDIFVKVSTDDVDYTTVFSTAENGLYSETAGGYQIDLPSGSEEPEEPEESGIVTDGLMMYYDAINNTGNGIHDPSATTWKDLSGNGNDGTINGAVFEDNRLSFDGVDDWVNCGRRDYKKVTVEAVVEYKQIGAVNQSIFGNWQAGGYGISYVCPYHNSNMHINGSWNRLNGSIPTTGKKYYLTATFDGSVEKLYEDGVLVSSVSVSGNIGSPTNSTVLSIGSNPNGSNIGIEPLNGYVYSVRLYNRALTEEEVVSNYNHDNTRFDPNAPVEPEEPTGDIYVEYLQSTGQQYFDTGVIPKTGTVAEIKFSLQSIGEYTHILSNDDFHFPCPKAGAINRFGYRNFSDSGYFVCAGQIDVDYVVKAFPSNKAIINGTEYAVNGGSGSSSTSLYLFTYAEEPSDSRFATSAKVYYCKIWQDDELIRDFVPIIRNRIAGMLDKVENKFYPSEGSARFIAGEVIEPPVNPEEPEEPTYYLIKENTLSAFGDEARRILASENTLTPSEMLDVFKDIASNSVIEVHVVNLPGGYSKRYLIEESMLKRLGDEARRIHGITDELTPSEILGIFRSITV